MKRKLYYLIFCFLGVLGVLCVSMVYAGVGSTGWIIFRKMQSPKPKPLVCTIAARGDLSGVLYNPSVLATIDRAELFTLGEVGMTEDKVTGLIYGHPLGKSGVAIGVLNYDAGKMSVSWIENDREQEKLVSAQNDLLGLISYGGEFTNKLHFGVTMKFATSKIADTTPAVAYAGDLSVSYLAGENLRLTFAGQNLGASTQFGDEKEKLPTSVWLGIGYALVTAKFIGGPAYFALGGDIPYLVDEKRITPSVGIEFGRLPISIFLGYRFNVQETSLTYGFMYYVNSFDVSYSYVPTRWLNPMHRVAVGIRLGTPLTPPLSHKGARDTITNKAKQIKYWFNLAKESFSQNKYTDAIKYWEEVLFIDPQHELSKYHITVSRDQIRQHHGNSLTRTVLFYQKGDYVNAGLELDKFLSFDPSNPELRVLRVRLDKVKAIVPEVKGIDKVSRLIRIGITNYFDEVQVREYTPTSSPAKIGGEIVGVGKGNPKISVQAIYYARQLMSTTSPPPSPLSGEGVLSVGIIEKLYLLIKDTYPEIVKEIENTVTPGLTLVEYKVKVAESAFLSNKYEDTVAQCRETLVLEPDNVVALKQLGSAYYALGRKQQAREIWQKALTLTPDDKLLKEFIQR